MHENVKQSHPQPPPFPLTLPINHNRTDEEIYFDVCI